MATIEKQKQEAVAGPELDALIAERVMGCKVQEVRNLEDLRLYHACDCRNFDHADPMTLSITGELKRYSTEVAAAWEVEERLKALGRWKEYGFILASLVRPDLVAGESIGNLYAELAHASPELRSRAALLALEADNA